MTNKKNQKNLIVLAASILFLFLTACATSSGGGGGGSRPSWVDNPPGDTGTAFSFVGAGSDPSGDEALARELAGGQVLSDITRFLGVRITSDTTVEARDAYGKFESNVTQIINEKSSAQIGDLRIKDVYVEKKAPGVTVFLLAEYDRAALLEEKARLEAVFTEQEEAVSGPEGEGDGLFSRGEYYQASLRFMEAALAASSSPLDNAFIKFERNINKARGAVEKIRLISLNNDLSGFRGERLDDGFRLLVTGRDSGDPPGLSGVPVRIFYKTLKRNGELGLVTASLQTDGRGGLEFQLPPPNFTGNEKVTMALDLGSSLEGLTSLPLKYLDQVDGLERAAAQKRVDFDYTVNSRAKLVSTALFVSDLDRNRNPMGRSDTTAGALEVLSGSGFRVTALPADESLGDLSDQALISRLKNNGGGTYSRVLYGFSEITGFEEADGVYLIRVSGTLRAIELDTGEVLYTANKISQARGRSEAGTISAAFKTLGKSLAEDMANSLP